VPKNCAALLGAILVMGGTVTSCPSGEKMEKGGSAPTNPNVPSRHTPAGETGERSVSALPPDLHAITSWLYQLDGYPRGRLDAVAASPHRLAVIDLARNGSEGYFTRSEIGRVRRSGKRILAYVEIGAIERYRPEYRTVADAGLVLNRWPEWPDEHFVRYWDPAWWALAVQPRVDRAISAGFDGVYLDTPLAYQEIDIGLLAGERETRRRDLAQRMVDLVVRISRYAKAARPGFWVVPQNSPELAAHPDYRTAIDGIGIEELFFRATGTRTDLPCTARWCGENLAAVRRLRDAGKLVLAVDYAGQPGNVRAACRRHRQERFAGYVTVRALDRIRPPCEGV
jgi:cysteinyl-tRNA synthetase